MSAGENISEWYVNELWVIPLVSDMLMSSGENICEWYEEFWMKTYVSDMLIMWQGSN